MSKRLHHPGTGEPTPRLLALRAGTEYLTPADVLELLDTLQEGEEGWGSGTRNVMLEEFGHWLAGALDESVLPAEIYW